MFGDEMKLKIFVRFRLIPFLSPWKCLNLIGGASPFGSSTGSTRVPIAVLPIRAVTGGPGDVTGSAELLLSFCSLLLFGNTNDEYKLVDIEGLVWLDSFVESERFIWGDSVFDIVADLVIV